MITASTIQRKITLPRLLLKIGEKKRTGVQSDDAAEQLDSDWVPDQLQLEPLDSVFVEFIFQMSQSQILSVMCSLCKGWNLGLKDSSVKWTDCAICKL
ncbi:hypothetical protein MRB53_011513 [Persea americana]|uniref:Uncharacterized protein n=1 Tax=Persea americana TaxID=3435 RepID=A0ACC2LV74_PERAE|nr:hypothetical protein MRB53_011513 [Persea americana]